MWKVYAGAAAIVGGLGALLVAHRRGLFFQHPLPAAAPSAPDAPAPPKAFRLLTGASVTLVPGVRYRACVDVPGLVPNGLVASRIPGRARDRGFRDVVVHDERPAGWESSAEDCDLWVEATWEGGGRTEVLKRPGEVPAAWAET